MINKVILVGNTGSDPEVRSFENGGKIARVNIATTEQIFNPTTNERRDHTEWHTLIFKNSLAGIVEMYIRKGRQLYVEGKIRSREWTDAQNVKHRSVEIHVDTMKMLGGKQENTQPLTQNTTNYTSTQQQPQYSAPQQPAMPQPNSQPIGQSQGFGTPSNQSFESQNDTFDTAGDDLPF